VGKKEPSFISGGNVNYYNQYGKKSMEAPQKTKSRFAI
jgi:hypothetical protein